MRSAERSAPFGLGKQENQQKNWESQNRRFFLGKCTLFCLPLIDWQSTLGQTIYNCVTFFLLGRTEHEHCICPFLLSRLFIVSITQTYFIPIFLTSYTRFYWPSNLIKSKHHLPSFSLCIRSDSRTLVYNLLYFNQEKLKTTKLFTIYCTFSAFNAHCHILS